MSVSGPFATAIAGPVAGPLTDPGVGGAAPVDPLLAAKALFLSGEQGYIYDPSVLSSMFQDLGPTTAAVVDSPVGHRRDLSGNNCHWTATGTTTRPILRFSGGFYYLDWDGVNDSGQTDSNIDFATLGEVTYIAGVRKGRDTDAPGIMAELTSDYTAAGGFRFGAPSYSSPTFGAGARGVTSGANAGSHVNNATFAAPYLGVFTGKLKTTSTALCEVRINGVSQATSATPQGSGGYGTGPVRNGFGFLGRTYLEIMRNKETTGALLTNAEALVTSRTG